MIPYVKYPPDVGGLRARASRRKTPIWQRSRRSGWPISRPLPRTIRRAPTSAEALLQLGMANEFGGHSDDAQKWYQKLVDGFPKTSQGITARGALTRLGSKGKPIVFPRHGHQKEKHRLGGRALSRQSRRDLLLGDLVRSLQRADGRAERSVREVGQPRLRHHRRLLGQDARHDAGVSRQAESLQMGANLRRRRQAVRTTWA